MKEKVVVGMSGGVDSSVAAYLLKEKGYDVIGVTMQIWREEGESLDAISAVEDARRIADKLGIDYYILDFRKEFKASVIDYFASEYMNGRTPNPCVVCNRFVKWEALLKKSKELGADLIATGHYARIVKYPETGRYVLKDSAAAKKDQTYALYNLTQTQLASTLMPIGEYTKDEVKKIASDIDLGIVQKPESQDICFVPDNDYASFLENNYGYKSKSGNYVDINGNVLGKHKGIIHYTVGQRKGLGLACNKHVFVNALYPESNEILIGSNEDLFKRTVYADRMNFMAVDKLLGDKRLSAKIRYAHSKAPCTVKMLGDNVLECTFDEPQRAPAPGQALVLYDGEYVYGGGTIIDSK